MVLGRDLTDVISKLITSAKLAFIPHTFFATYLMNLKSASNSAFFDTHIELLKRKKLDHITTFC
jgi:hypothetical protein